MRGDELGQVRGTGTNAPEPEPTWYGVAVGALMLAVGLFGLVATALVGAVGTESDTMAVAYVAVPAFFGGVVAPIAALFVRRQPLPIAMGVPVGCGCGTITVGVVLMVVFFTALWPRL